MTNEQHRTHRQLGDLAEVLRQLIVLGRTSHPPLYPPSVMPNLVMAENLLHAARKALENAQDSAPIPLSGLD